MRVGWRPQVFLSYRHGDVADAADRLRIALKGHFGAENVFVDVDDLAVGDDFPEVIEQRVRRSDIVVVVIGPGWLSAANWYGSPRLDDPDDFVRLEIEEAILCHKRIVPVLVYGATMPRTADLPDSLWPLASRTAATVPRASFDVAVEKLISGIERIVAELDGEMARERLDPDDRDRREVRTFCDHLEPDETWIDLVWSDRVALMSGSSKGLVVLTDRRVLLIAGPAVAVDIPLTTISSRARTVTRLWDQGVEFRTADGRRWTFRRLRPRRQLPGLIYGINARTGP